MPTANMKKTERSVNVPTLQPPAQTAVTMPVAPIRRATMRDHKGYADACDRLAVAERDLAAANAKANAAAAQLGFTITGNPELDNKARAALKREAAAVKFVNGDNQESSVNVDALMVVLDEAIETVDVLTRAVRMLTPLMEKQRFEAYQAVLKSVQPIYSAAIARHAEAVVAAVKSKQPLRQIIDDVLADSPPLAGGLGDYGFPGIGNGKHHGDAVQMWLSDLIGLGFLDGNEPFLRDVPMVCRRPDGSVIDRPAPDIRNALFEDHPAAKPAGLLSRVKDAASGLFSPRQADERLPSPPRPPIDGATRQVRMLKHMASSTHDWNVGEIAPWAAHEVDRLIALGYVELVE